MSNVAISRLERCYMKAQTPGADTDFNTAASLGNSNYCRHIKLMVKNNVDVLIRRDKTGTRSQTLGVKGREYGSWSYEGSLALSGTAGTVPDFDPILQSIFGQASTSGGGGVVYNFVDTPNMPITIASYRTPSTLNQKIGVGCLVNKAVFKIGEDIAEFTAEGDAKYVVESDYFSSALTEELCGLGSFPAEPGSPVSHGGIIAGFTGAITIGGNAQIRIRTATITIEPQAKVVRDTFGFYTPQTTEADFRMVTMAAQLYEDDSTAQQALRVAALNKTPLAASLTVGTVAGNIANFTLNNILLASPDSDDSGLRYSMNFPESRAFGTSITSRDECVVTLT